MPRVRLIAVMTVGCAFAVGGCVTGNGGASDRSVALRAVGGTHELCFSTSVTGKTVTEGLDTIVNRGRGPVHVDRVEWLNNDGLTPLGISVFQRQDGDKFSTFGTWPGYPPKHLVRDGGPTMRAAWARQVPAEGATLPVTTDVEQHYLNLVVGFSGARGSAGPVRLHYTDADGHHGTVDTLVTVTTYPTCP